MPKAPCASVVVVRVWFVAVQTAVIVAPGSTPPVPSVTEPLMSPVVRCAKDEIGNAETTAIVRQATQRRCSMKGAPSKFARGTATRKVCGFYAARPPKSIQPAAGLAGLAGQAGRKFGSLDSPTHQPA